MNVQQYVLLLGDKEKAQIFDDWQHYKLGGKVEHAPIRTHVRLLSKGMPLGLPESIVMQELASEAAMYFANQYLKTNRKNL